ncbi:MAG: Serine/threonine protein kinase, partial [Variovorax sp.]|nr:Serine/threonine protein kinase [Variovorax sp.]
PGIAGVEHLESAVDEEAVNPLGRQPATGVPGGVDHVHVAPGIGQAGGRGQTGQPGADDDDLGTGWERHGPNLDVPHPRHRRVPWPVEDGAACGRRRHRSGRPPYRPGMPVDPASQPVPVVPGYVLEHLLGRGGSGQVWRAHPRGGGDPVAVKVLVRGDPERQVREAAMLAELDHPHLVRLQRVVRREIRGGPAEVALVLDLLAGGSLAGLLTRRGRLRPGEVVTTVAPVAAALAQAHERGVVHGDLSPGNIVFTAEGRPVLTDLGTARLVGDVGRAEVTPAYVDPVVARGGAPGPASDVFGVAAAAFHALTGIAPWNAADPAGTLGVAARGEVPDLALLAPQAPAELVRVIARGLSLEPHLRGSAAAFALDLRHACPPEPVRLPVEGVPDGVLGETGRGPRTELTHQLGESRPRGAHAWPAAAGRWARWRAGLVRPGTGGAEGRRLLPAEEMRPLLRGLTASAAALVLLAGALAGAVWLGASWGGDDVGAVPAAETVRAPAVSAPRSSTGPSPSPSASPAPSTAPESASAADGQGKPSGGPTVDPGGADPGDADPGDAAARVDKPADVEAPADVDGWAALLGQLYARRAGAYVTADPSRLEEVYTPDSDLLGRDRDQITALATAGLTVSDFTPTVRQVTSAAGDGRTVVLDLVDEVPAYRVVPAGGGAPAGEVAGRGPARVRMTLARTPDGWRIAAATLGS